MGRLDQLSSYLDHFNNYPTYQNVGRNEGNMRLVMEQWNLSSLPNKAIQKIAAWFTKTEIKLIFCRDTTTERIAQINAYLVNYFENFFEGYVMILIVISINSSRSFWQIYWKKPHHINLLVNFPRNFKLAIFGKRLDDALSFCLKLKAQRPHNGTLSYTYISYTR